MNVSDLQTFLSSKGFYTGKVDDNYGPKTKDALMRCLAAGPDTKLTPADIARAAASLGTTPAHVRTVCDVEAAGAGFQDGLPKVLFEGHIFSRLTRHRYDATHSGISYPNWDASKYPKTQAGRYLQIVEAVGLDVDAGFSAASYGLFQILGSNFKAAGFPTAMAFVMAQCQCEGTQLDAFVSFLKSTHLDAALRTDNWAAFAKGYNGPAYRQNAYDTKLAAAFAREKAKG